MPQSTTQDLLDNYVYLMEDLKEQQAQDKCLNELEKVQRKYEEKVEELQIAYYDNQVNKINTWLSRFLGGGGHSLYANVSISRGLLYHCTLWGSKIYFI